MSKIKYLIVYACVFILACSCASTSGEKNDAEIAPASDGVNVVFNKASLFDGSQAKDIVFNDDGSVTYKASAAGSGGGVVFYIKSDASIINISNYDSVDIEVDCVPVEGKWASGAKKPGFGFRLFTPEATGFWSGFEDVEYFDYEGEGNGGSIVKTVKITDACVKKYVDSCENDDILGFTMKFNAYQRGNADNDELSVTIKSVTFNKKPGTPADAPTSDGLTDADRGTVSKVTYPSHDYVSGDTTEYQKPAWVYLPAGYDADDKNTKYPLLILMHGFNQNQDTWGLRDTGTGGKIKGYMDRGMFSGDVAKFVLVVVNGVASKSYAAGRGDDFNGFNAFGGELRNDIIPFMRANYNIADGRGNVAMAGLSMGGSQTMNIGIGDTLDLISWFGAFSFPVPAAADFNNKMKANGFESYDINYLYTICGDQDFVAAWDAYEQGVKDLSSGFDKVELGENFSYERFEGGTHDFPVWYRGFKNFIPLIFK
jgi:S-formylglutathione hydrolase FrmB